MHARLTYGAFAVVLGLAALVGTATRGASQVMPSGGGSATFSFTTSVQTPKGKQSGSGTIVVKHTQGRSLTVTVNSSDGKTKTIPLVVGSDGSVAPDPSAPAPAATDHPDAAARAFMANVTLAAHVGMAEHKSSGAATLSVPVNLTPVGDGTPVPTQLRLSSSQSGAMTTYTGSVSGNTLTKLPPSGGLDPATLAKTVGVGAIAHHAFGPAGRIATAVAMHHKKEEEKKAAAGLLADAMTLNVTMQMPGGKFHQIDGTQTDTVTVESKKVTITSKWTFTKTSP